MSLEELWEMNTDYCYVCGSEHSYMSTSSCDHCGAREGFTKKQPTEGKALLRLAKQFHEGNFDHRRLQDGGALIMFDEDWWIRVDSESRLDDVIQTLQAQIEEGGQDFALAKAKALLRKFLAVHEGRR